MTRGCVQVYTGDGKGKTTAAVGLAVRGAGAGRRVFVGQFIKGRDSSEMALLRERCPEITVEQFGAGRFVQATPSPADIAAGHNGVMKLREALASRAYDIVIADEANGAVAASVIGLDDLLGLIDMRPEPVELVITGRNARPEVLDRADLVTEMRCVRHCLDAGVPARRGIDF